MCISTGVDALRAGNSSTEVRNIWTSFAAGLKSRPPKNLNTAASR